MSKDKTTASKAPAAPPETPDSRLWTRTFVTILFVNFSVFLGFNMMLPTLSLYLDSRELTEREIGLVFGSFTISAITFRLLASRLSIRFGTLAVVRLGFLTCGMGALCFILVDHMSFYFLARLMQGAGFAVSSTLLVSVAADVIPPRRLGEGIGYVGLGATLSLALGPVLGLDLVKRAGFGAMFVTASFTCLAAMFISYLLPKIPKPAPASGSPGGKSGWLEKKALAPALLSFVYGAGVSGVTVFLAIYCEQNGLPPAANFFMASTAGTVIARLTSGKIYDRRGHLFVIPPAVVLLGASVAAIILVPPDWVLYTAAVVYGLGAGAIFPAVQTLTLASVPPEKRTIASAYFFVAFDSGIGLGTVILGFLAGFRHNYGSVFYGSLFFFGMLLIIYFLICLKRKPAEAMPEKTPPE